MKLMRKFEIGDETFDCKLCCSKIEYLEQEKVCEEDIEKLYTELLEASKGEEGLDVSRITNSY